ncbi:MAG TPA: amidohydrolase family protein [Thermoanaerobaculia bacterium]|nr:amidohydrolase family protein [Thermoanaerobaculia bacterium]
MASPSDAADSLRAAATSTSQARLQRAHPGRYLGVAGIDPAGVVHDPLAEIQRAVEELDLRAIALEPGREPFDAPHPADPRLHPIYALIQELGATLMLQTSGYYGGRNLDYANPRWIDQLAESFPELRIVCGHGCYPWARELVAVAVRRHHVYPSPDLYLYTPARREWTYAVNRGLIADQLLFGSGYPLGLPLEQSVRRFLIAGWRPRRLDRILYRSALRAFALEVDPAFAEAAAAGRRYGAGSMLIAAVRLVLGEIWRRGRARH